MPFISTKTSVTVTKEKEEALTSKLGKAIELFPGKSEQWLMLSFEDNCHLWFQGSATKPIAYVEVKLFGKASEGAYRKMTAALTEIIGEELGVAPTEIYIKYEEVEHWGWNGGNF